MRMVLVRLIEVTLILVVNLKFLALILINLVAFWSFLPRGVVTSPHNNLLVLSVVVTWLKYLLSSGQGTVKPTCM